MIRTVIVGGGMVGLTLARLLRARGHDPVVLERAPAGVYGARGFMLGWPQGSTGSRRIDRVGEEAATAPALDLFLGTFARLLPEAREIVAGITSWDQVRYVEPRLLRCPRWWVPGVIAIGDCAHTFGPDTGVGAGIGLQDAHALAEAIARSPDADTACESYVTWREPAVRPYEAMDPAWRRMGEIPPAIDAEAWPPVTLSGP